MTFLISTKNFLAVDLYFLILCALSSKLIQNGDAMKKVDNPPTMTPIDIGSAKSLICGTNIATDRIVKSVVRSVPTDLEKDSLKERLMISLLDNPG